MAEIASITEDTKDRTVRVVLSDGRGEIFGGTMADYHAYCKRQSAASNDLVAAYSLIDAKLDVDPTLKDTSDIIAKPLDYVAPVVLITDPVLVDPVIDPVIDPTPVKGG